MPKDIGTLILPEIAKAYSVISRGGRLEKETGYYTFSAAVWKINMHFRQTARFKALNPSEVSFSSQLSLCNPKHLLPSKPNYSDTPWVQFCLTVSLPFMAHTAPTLQ